MDVTAYKKVFTQARADLEKLVEQREEMDQEISRLKQAIIGLAPLAEEPVPTNHLIALLGVDFVVPGVTDSIREILKTSEKPLAPIEVKQRLLQLKPDVSRQTNLMATIHTVLKRLVPKEATVSTDNNGDTIYRWIRRFPRHRHHRHPRLMTPATNEASGPQK
jgi:hypothetical protein